MRITHDDLQLCDDCTIVAVNDDVSGIDYYAENEAAAEARRVAIYAGLERLGPHLVPHYDSETGDGVTDFTSRGCDCCRTHLAGSRTRFAVLAP